MSNCSPSSPSKSTLLFPPLPAEVILSEELGADACPWLDDYIQFSRKWSPESYDGFHETCGLFGLSTIAARRVGFNLGRIRYTNLYLALVGRTSIHAKTTAAEIAVDVIDNAGLDWFLAPDNSTPQKLIEDMSSTDLPDVFPDLNEELRERIILRALTSGQRGWFVDEFGSHVSAMMQRDGVMLIEKESREEYRAAISTIFSYGTLFDYGQGKQVSLGMDYWNCDKELRRIQMEMWA